MITLITISLVSLAIISGVYYVAHKVNPTTTQADIDKAKAAIEAEAGKVSGQAADAVKAEVNKVL